MVKPVLEEKLVKTALLQFLFPFSLNADCQFKLKVQLKIDGFVPFSLDNLEMETAFYGPGYRVSHSSLERYYLPFTNSVIFPHEESDEVFLRFSKSKSIECEMKTMHRPYSLSIHSV